MPTIKEVSELAGVSLATVSRVMNGSDRVKAETRVRVKAAMEELGYTPNSAAQSLAGNRSNTLGMVVSWLDGPFYGPVMSGVEEELRRHNRHVIIAAGHGDIDQEREVINYLKARRVDGLILLTEGLREEDLLALGNELPIYLINQHFEKLEDRNMWLDNEYGGYAATRYLIEQGHERIVCAAGQKFKQDARDRVAGYKRAMKEAGLPYSSKHICHTVFDLQGGLTAMRSFDEEQLDFTAVFAGSDEMAIGALDWARAKGLNVPKDLSVIGFDNQMMAQYVSPKLTTIDFPAFDMAKACARSAIQEIYHKQKASGLKFTPSLVIRDTVAPPGR